MLLQVDKSRFLLLSFLCLRKSLAMDYSTHETTLKSISFHLTDVRARAYTRFFPFVTSSAVVELSTGVRTNVHTEKK